MGDMGDDFRAFREHKRSIRNKWEGKNRKFIQTWAEVNDVGCDELEGSQIRLDGRQTLDIWPQWLKWHNITTGERGQCRNQEELAILLSDTLIEVE